MTVQHLADARAFRLHGFTFRPLATPSLGTTELALWHVDAPAGAASPPHSMSREEVFVVQRGRLDATVAGVEVALGPGDALTVPAGATLVLRNTTDAPAEALACTSVGMEATVGGNVMAPPWAA
ncbi:cupin domain-containing protein [Cellulomonas sp. URHB0016]